jgi:hypothetical protein
MTKRRIIAKSSDSEARRVWGCWDEPRNELLALLSVTTASQYNLGAAKAYIVRDTRMIVARIEGLST